MSDVTKDTYNAFETAVLVVLVLRFLEPRMTRTCAHELVLRTH